VCSVAFISCQAHNCVLGTSRPRTPFIKIKNVPGLTIGDRPKRTRPVLQTVDGVASYNEAFWFPFSHKLCNLGFAVVDNASAPKPASQAKKHFYTHELVLCCRFWSNSWTNHVSSSTIRLLALPTAYRLTFALLWVQTELLDQQEHLLVLKLQPQGELHVKAKATFGFPLLAPGQSTVITSPYVAIGLGWDTIKDKVDLDTGLIGFDERLKVVNYISFQTQAAKGMQHGGDNRTGDGNGDDEQVKVLSNGCPIRGAKLCFCFKLALNQLDPRVQFVGLVVCSFNSKPFTSLKSFYFRVRQVNGLAELSRTRPTCFIFDRNSTHYRSTH